MSCSPLRHGQAPTGAAWRRTSSMEQASHSVAAPRAQPTEDRRRASQQQDQFGCETAWSPASPSSYSCGLPSMSFSDAIQEAAALSKPTMHRATGNHADYHRHSHSHSNSSNIALKTERSDDPAMVAASTFELDRDMMGMLANLNAGPPRAPVANWGFEPTPTEAQALYDPNAAFMAGSNQQVALSGSMMMTPSASAEMTHILGMVATEPDFVSGAMDNNNESTTVGPAADPFSSMDSGFVMPYQDCTTLPVSGFPPYDNGMYKPAFDNSAQFTPHAMDNHLGEVSTPFFGNSGVSQAMMVTDPTFQGTMGNNSATTLFNEVAQPPAASMLAINGGFAMSDLSLQEDDDSDWNGSSSDFSTVSSSPISKTVNLTSSSSTPTTAVAPGATSRTLTTSKDGSKKAKRIRRLCSVAGRNGLCSTHLRLLGQESDGKVRA
ncbi:hypothetical protein PRNP1_013611 [Phytophthora ramorum]